MAVTVVSVAMDKTTLKPGETGILTVVAKSDLQRVMAVPFTGQAPDGVKVNGTINVTLGATLTYTASSTDPKVKIAQTGDTTFSVTVAPDATAGDKGVTVLVSDGSATSASASGSITVPQGVDKPVGKIRLQWYHSWKGPKLRDIPKNAAAGMNMYSLAIAQSAQSGTGKISWTPQNNGQSDADFIADVKALKASGTSVLLGIGGSGDGGIALKTTANAQEMFATASAIIDKYGLAGIDFDIESGAWVEAAVVSFVDLLRNKYGSGFIFGLTVQFYGDLIARWGSLARRLGEKMTYFAPMLYDFPEAHDAARLLPVAKDKIERAKAQGIPSSKYVLGLMCNEYYNTTPTADAVKVAQGVLAAYPDLAGVMHWEHGSDAAHGWPVALQVLPLFK